MKRHSSVTACELENVMLTCVSKGGGRGSGVNRREGNDQESIQLPNAFRPRHQGQEGHT